MTLAQRHGQSVVVQLTPPDFVQVFAPASPPPPAAPPGSAGAEDAARLFLRGYLPWLYGHAPLRTITGARSGLLGDLKTHPPRVLPTMQTLAPKIVAIAMRRHGRGWQALPNVTDGRETYELVLTVADTRAVAGQQRQLPAMSTRSAASTSTRHPGVEGVLTIDTPEGGSSDE